MIDLKKSQENRPFHPHTKNERIPSESIVKLEFGLWSTGIVFEKGEILVLKVAGHHITLAETNLSGVSFKQQTRANTVFILDQNTRPILWFLLSKLNDSEARLFNGGSN